MDPELLQLCFTLCAAQVTMKQDWVSAVFSSIHSGKQTLLAEKVVSNLQVGPGALPELQVFNLENGSCRGWGQILRSAGSTSPYLGTYQDKLTAMLYSN